MLQTIVLVFFLFLSLISPISINAQQNCDPSDTTHIAQFGPCPAALSEFEDVVRRIITVIAGLGFMALMVLLVWAGIKYLTSGGDPKTIQSTHQIVTWAILGIIFLALAWLVLKLIATFTGRPELLQFNIQTLVR